MQPLSISSLLHGVIHRLADFMSDERQMLRCEH
jgi:hypothetical protein